MRVHKRKKVGFFHYFLVIFTICFVIFGLIILGSLITSYVQDTQVTTTTTTEPIQVMNLEAVILDTKGKLIQANAYIRITDGITSTIGSAVIIDSDSDYYYAITNDHVVSDSESKTKTISTYDLINSDFEIIATSENDDLALIRFEKSGRSSIIPLLISGKMPSMGEFVMAIGNPIGSVGSVTIGTIQTYTTISNTIDQTHEALQHTATLGNGSSGGALVDLYGNLIGLNSWGISDKYYAIPSSVILSFIESQNLL